jgi:hypothetical protein
MCCIIHRPKGAKEIATYKLSAIICRNPHGWGLSYMKNGKLQIVKSMSMKDATTRIRELEKDDIEFLFHARWATHGDKTIDNCHPFNVTNGVLFHNGKIDVFCKNKELSDTYHFSLKINALLRKGKSIEWIIKKFRTKLGLSRLAFMGLDGTIIKFGEWHELDQCFYSKLDWRWDDWGWGTCGVSASHHTASSTKSKPSESWTYKDAFKNAIECCQENKALYRYLAKDLNDKELISIAIHFPRICAEYLAGEYANHKIH